MTNSAAWCLQERGFPDINIITEKVAFQGITRFEDRGRLPLGSNFNVTSFSARILSQAAYNPKAGVLRPLHPFCLHVTTGCHPVQDKATRCRAITVLLRRQHLTGTLQWQYAI